jgi:hypothetical protein
MSLQTNKRYWAFYSQGLMMARETARALEVGYDDLERWTMAGLIPHVSFNYKGQIWTGYPVTEVLALRRKMGLTP